MSNVAGIQWKSTQAAPGVGACFEPEFVHPPSYSKILRHCWPAPEMTARQESSARAPARRTHILNGIILHRPWISIRMSLVYAIAKKAIGLIVNAATFDRFGWVYPQGSLRGNYKPRSTPAGRYRNSGGGCPLRRTSRGSRPP